MQMLYLNMPQHNIIQIFGICQQTQFSQIGLVDLLGIFGQVNKRPAMSSTYKYLILKIMCFIPYETITNETQNKLTIVKLATFILQPNCENQNLEAKYLF